MGERHHPVWIFLPSGSFLLTPFFHEGLTRGDILNHMVQYHRGTDDRAKTSPPGPHELDVVFAALSDPTRRGVLERLGRADASITELADGFGMTLTGMKKHVRILEEAGLVASVKVGRVRRCALGPRRLDLETAWIARYQQSLDERLDRLAALLERMKGEPR